MCSIKNTMMNGKLFFSMIHHNDLGIFLVQCYIYRQYTHKYVLKYLRILFLYSEHTNTR